MDQALLRRREERIGAGRLTSIHFFFAVAAPNLYEPPFAAMLSTILIHGTLSGFCFLSSEGCVTSSLSNSSCTKRLSSMTYILVSKEHQSERCMYVHQSLSTSVPGPGSPWA